jgi:hypothetical protein
MVGEPGDETVTSGWTGPRLASAGGYVGPVDDPDRYELIGQGLRGGEGTTWQARYHGRLQAPLPLAVKQFHPPPGAPPDWPSAEDMGRWQDQTALLRHTHPEHVVRLYELFSGPPPHAVGQGGSGPGRAPYLVMEWINGPTLGQLCRGAPATKGNIETRMGYVHQVALALAELSSATRTAGNPSLHRDVKPGNCIVNHERGLVLIDTGTLRLIDDGFDPLGRHTPGYTAPEAMVAPHLPRSSVTEVYALGALAAFCLTGRDPGVHGGLVPGLDAAAREAGVADPAALAAHILTALDSDPARRPGDLAGWSQRLVTLARVRPRRWPYVAALTAVVAAVLLVVESLQGTGRVNRPAGGGAASTTSAAARPVGAITLPADGADVRQCEYFEGTATVPAGLTLVLLMHNLVNHDPAGYAQVIFGWEDRARLNRWRGAQFFGQDNDTVGQDYRVELVAVPLDTVRAWRKTDDSGTALERAGTVLAQVDLQRVTGPGPNNGCVP